MCDVTLSGVAPISFCKHNQGIADRRFALSAMTGLSVALRATFSFYLLVFSSFKNFLSIFLQNKK
jgi:hypothetical protein